MPDRVGPSTQPPAPTRAGAHARETDPMPPPLARCRRLAALPCLLLAGAAQAQVLDVKPGLWEMTLEGAKAPVQVCYTAEMLRGGLSNVPVPQGMTCRTEVKMARARTVLTRTVCAGDMSLEGETRIDIASPEAMTMVSGSMLIVGGRKQTMQSTAHYRWLRADCGAVKPDAPGRPPR